jgi:hypothetical protein
LFGGLPFSRAANAAITGLCRMTSTVGEFRQVVCPDGDRVTVAPIERIGLFSKWWKIPLG